MLLHTLIAYLLISVILILKTTCRLCGLWPLDTLIANWVLYVEIISIRPWTFIVIPFLGKIKFLTISNANFIYFVIRTWFLNNILNGNLFFNYGHAWRDHKSLFSSNTILKIFEGLVIWFWSITSRRWWTFSNEIYVPLWKPSLFCTGLEWPIWKIGFCPIHNKIAH